MNIEESGGFFPIPMYDEAFLRSFTDLTPVRIVHVHLKDWNGSYARDADGKEIDRSGYVNYEPVGNGILPMPEIFAIPAADGGFDGWINVELDGTARAPRPAREAARMSRYYLETLLGDDVSWTS